jgi:hypothetical protein
VAGLRGSHRTIEVGEPLGGPAGGRPLECGECGRLPALNRRDVLTKLVALGLHRRLRAAEDRQLEGDADQQAAEAGRAAKPDLREEIRHARRRGQP